MSGNDRQANSGGRAFVENRRFFEYPTRSVNFPTASVELPPTTKEGMINPPFVVIPTKEGIRCLSCNASVHKGAGSRLSIRGSGVTSKTRTP